MSMVRGWAVGLVVALAIASCGGNGASVSTGDDAADPSVGTVPALDDPELQATIEETAALALERFGDLETAGVAILIAYDLGYSFDQIVAGVRSGALSADGAIEGVELAQGFASFRGPALAADLSPVDIEDARKAFARALDRQMSFYTERLLEAISLGVPSVRIVQAIVLGTDEFFGMVERADRHTRYRKRSEGWWDCLEEADELYGPGVVEPFEPDDTDEPEPISEAGEPPSTTATSGPAATADDGLAPTHELSAVLALSEDGAEIFYEWSGTFAVTDDGDISGGGSIVGRTAGVCDVADIDATTGEYRTVGEGSFELDGNAVGDNLEIEFANATGQLTTREGDESQLCVDISFDVAEALFGLELGGADDGGPILVSASGEEVSLEPPEWGVVINVIVVRR